LLLTRPSKADAKRGTGEYDFFMNGFQRRKKTLLSPLKTPSVDEKKSVFAKEGKKGGGGYGPYFRRSCVGPEEFFISRKKGAEVCCEWSKATKGRR